MSTTTEKPAADTIRLSLLGAIGAVDNLTRDLISAELRELEPFYRENVRLKTAAAKAAEAECIPVRARLAQIDREIDNTIGKVSEYERRMSDARAELRVEAHRWFTEWSAELDRVNDERARVESELGELENAYAKALAEADAALDGMVGLADAIANPTSSTLGRMTNAYQQFRAPMTWRVILEDDRKSPEWETAINQLRMLCTFSGYRTTDLPSDAEAGRKFWDHFRDSHQPAENAPDLGGAIAELHAPFIDAQLHKEGDKTTARIEDHTRSELRIPWRLHGGNQA